MSLIVKQACASDQSPRPFPRPWVLAAASGIVAICGAATPLRAATVLRVSKTKMKVLLGLTQQEMAELEDDEDVVAEVDAKPRLILSGTLTRLNPLKRSVVIELEDPADDRLARKQHVRFLSVFANAADSPLITSFAQYHQYKQAFVEAAGGGFFAGEQSRSGGNRGSRQITGTQAVLTGYAPLYADILGLALVYERRDGGGSLKNAGASTTITTSYDRIAPGLWLGWGPDWRFGLRYDYTLISQVDSGALNANYAFQLGQPVLSIVSKEDDQELGMDLSSRDAVTQTSYGKDGSAGSVPHTQTYKMPASAYLYVRNVSSPLFVWGLGLGYLFFERSNGSGQPLDAKATLPQTLQARASFERRLEGGAKLDEVVVYNGGKTKSLSTLDQEANEIGLASTYQTTLGDRYLVGGTLTVAAGAGAVSDRSVDPVSGVETDSQRTVVGYQISLLLFASYNYPPLKATPRQ